jgi:hypothetical protein
MPTYGSYTIDRPIETARGGGDAQPTSVADAAAPHGWGLKGGDTHTCHARPGRRAPQVHGNCTMIGRRRFNEAAGCARLAYDELTAAVPIRPHTDAAHSTPSCVHPARRVHPSILPQMVLVSPWCRSKRAGPSVWCMRWGRWGPCTLWRRRPRRPVRRGIHTRRGRTAADYIVYALTLVRKHVRGDLGAICDPEDREGAQYVQARLPHAGCTVTTP